MAVLHRKIVHQSSSSFSHIAFACLTLPRHKHEEYELMIFTKGSGKQFIGDGVADYGPNDMALIGSNIPHFHLCNTVLTGQKENRSAGEVLQFPPSLFPPEMDKIPEYSRIHTLLNRSQYGIRFHDPHLTAQIYGIMQGVNHLNGIPRLTLLLHALDKLSRCKNYTLFSTTEYNSDNSFNDISEPVNRVYTYLFNHFREEISLASLAAYAGQHPSALCRYFKKHTDQSIFRCLSGIRVGHACKLLAYSNLSVSQIAYESGFNNLSNFNKQFRLLTNRTPTEYRRLINL